LTFGYRTCYNCFVNKFCPGCQNDVDTQLFNKNKARHDGLGVYCKKCLSQKTKLDPGVKVRQKEYYLIHKTQILKYRSQYVKTDDFRDHAKIYRDSTRIQVFQRLGGSCCHCKEDTLEFLCVDHVNGEGFKETNNIHFLQKILKNPDLSQFQTLCYNCNWAKYVKSRPIELNHKAGPGQKTCHKCGQSLELCYFSNSQSRNSGIWSNCKYCVADIAFQTKVKCLVSLGGICICCGTDDPYKLTIDHKFNDGYQRRSEGWGTTIYTKLLHGSLKLGDYQILCCNCNISKHIGHGVCVHKRTP
jgi:hypothetical protein